MAEKKQSAEDIRIEDDAKLLADTLDDILLYSGDSADEAYISYLITYLTQPLGTCLFLVWLKLGWVIIR